MNITKVPIIQIIKNGETIEVNPLTSVNDIGVSSGSLKLITSIVDRELSFGKLISSQFSVQLFNIDDNLEGCSIQLFLEEDGVRTSKFKGTIESSKRDNIGDYRDIIAYDWFYYHRNDDISNWWNNFWVSTRTSATIQEIRISLLTYINMIDIKGYPSNSIYPSNELYPHDVIDSYINDSIVIPNNFNFYTELKLDTILRMICELQAIFPHIDENGNMEFISIINTNTSDLTGLYEGSNSKWEDYTTDLITGVGIYSTSNDLSQLIGTSDNVYNISGNLFALTLDAQTLNTLGNNILSAISNIQFTPSKIKMIVSDFDLKLGQRINTPKGYGYVMTNSLSGVCLIEQTIESKSMGSKLSQRVDSRNDTLIEGAKMSKFEQTIDGFTTEVQRIDNVATQASSDASEALQTADGLADDVQTANNNASTALSTANNANTTAITAQSQVTQMADQIVLKVDNNGNVVQVALSSDASTGSNVLIKGDNIQLDGNVTITSGFVLNAGVIQSQNYLAGTSGTKINLSDGTIDTKYFKVASDGKITSTGGTIGGFTIGTSAIYNGMTSLSDTTHNGIYIGTDGIALGKGAFKVTSAGAITANNATILGSITFKDSIKVYDTAKETTSTLLNMSVTQASSGIPSMYTLKFLYPGTSTAYLTVTPNSTPFFDGVADYATSAGSATNASYLKGSGKITNGNQMFVDDGMKYFIASSSMTTGKPPEEACVIHAGWDWQSWHRQLAMGTNYLYYRCQNKTTWGAWKTVLDSSNYTNYCIRSYAQSGSFNKVGHILEFSGSNNYLGNTSKGNYIWAVSSWSDIRLKKNIKDSRVNALELINKIQMREFDFKDEKFGTHKDIGYVAQELMEVIPECVEEVELPDEDKEKYGVKSMYQVEDKHIIPYLVKALQEQQRQIEELKQSNNFYQNIILQMQAEIEQIKQKTEE